MTKATLVKGEVFNLIRNLLYSVEVLAHYHYGRVYDSVHGARKVAEGLRSLSPSSQIFPS